jgi:hypothetical protein
VRQRLHQDFRLVLRTGFKRVVHGLSGRRARQF